MTRFSSKLEDDLLYQALADGTADDEDQHEAAEWLKALHTEHASGVERLTGEVALARSALDTAQNALASANHLVRKYVPEHHWLPRLETDMEAIKAARTALQDGGKK